jgi:hypothetical protein
MKGSRFRGEQIVGVLKEAEAGVPMKDLCRRIVDEALFLRSFVLPAEFFCDPRPRLASWNPTVTLLPPTIYSIFNCRP